VPIEEPRAESADDVAARRRRKFPDAFAFAGRKTIIHVRDVDGRPVEGAQVFRGAPKALQIRTDADGEAVFGLSVSLGGHIRVEHRTGVALHEVKGDEFSVESVDVTLRPSAHVEGKVLHADGTAATGRRVRLRTRSKDGPNYSSVAVVDRTGAFRFEPLPVMVLEAGVQLCEEGREGGTPPVRVRPPWNDEHIDLPPLVVVRGRLLDEDGRPIFVAWVSDSRAHGTWTDRHGRFSVRLFGAPSGQLRIWKLKHPELLVPIGMNSKDLGDLRFPADMPVPELPPTDVDRPAPVPEPIAVGVKLQDATTGQEIAEAEMKVLWARRGSRDDRGRLWVDPSPRLRDHPGDRQRPGLALPQAGTYDLLLNFRDWELVRLRGVEINRTEPKTLTVKLHARKP
jgi:hypothetical protein